jgi:hypothetical protein
MDWRAIDPTIFGTLFERGLDPAARAPLGAHYTDTGTIAKLIEPLIREPLAAEWAVVKAPNRRAKAPKARKAKRALHQGFLLRLRPLPRPRPGLRLRQLPLPRAQSAARHRETRPRRRAGTRPATPNWSMQTGPHNILGLEINEFAAELARVTVWIGDIQWCRATATRTPSTPF